MSRTPHKASSASEGETSSESEAHSTALRLANMEKGAACARTMLMQSKPWVRARTLAKDIRSLSTAEADGYARQISKALELVEKLGVSFHLAESPDGSCTGIGATLTFKDPLR